MKLQFDAHQDYQIEAVRAVVALFAGQPDASQTAISVSDTLSSLALTETGVANRRVIDDAQWLANLHAVQEAHGIEPSDALATMMLDDGTPELGIKLVVLFWLMIVTSLRIHLFINDIWLQETKAKRDIVSRLDVAVSVL